jgi:histidine triad (HIT) family protein
MEDCIFCKLIRKEIPTNVVYEDDDVFVFNDMHPIKPIHLLVIPKKHIHELMKVEDPQLFAQLFSVVQKMAKEKGLDTQGFRIRINGGGAQEVQHLHIHLMGPMGSNVAM